MLGGGVCLWLLGSGSVSFGSCETGVAVTRVTRCLNCAGVSDPGTECLRCTLNSERVLRSGVVVCPGKGTCFSYGKSVGSGKSLAGFILCELGEFSGYARANCGKMGRMLDGCLNGSLGAATPAEVSAVRPRGIVFSVGGCSPHPLARAAAGCLGTGHRLSGGAVRSFDDELLICSMNAGSGINFPFHGPKRVRVAGFRVHGCSPIRGIGFGNFYLNKSGSGDY